MSQNSDEQALDPIAAFLAKGGKIQTIEPGVRKLNEREIRAKVLGDSYTDRRMRDAENQVEVYNPYYR